MHTKCTTKIKINKVGIEFTSKKITAYILLIYAGGNRFSH